MENGILHDEGADKGAIHMVSAWATQNRLVLGVKVDENQMKLRQFRADKDDGVIWLYSDDWCDGCQKGLSIAEQDADYIISLKKNQGSLYKM